MLRRHPFWLGFVISCGLVISLKVAEERARDRGDHPEMKRPVLPAAQVEREAETTVPGSAAHPEAALSSRVSTRGAAPTSKRLIGPQAGAVGVIASPESAAAPVSPLIPQARDAAVGDQGVEAQLLFSPDSEGIKAALREQVAPAVRECYRGWLEESPALEGRVLISFEIPAQRPAESGEEEGMQIRGASLKVDELEHPFMSSCLLNSLAALRFERPESAKPIQVNYPFRFQATPSPKESE